MPELASLHVHLLHPPDSLAVLHERLMPSITVSTGPELLPTTQILVAGRPTRTHLDSAPDLRALVIPFAGLPASTRDLLRDYPRISVHNLHHNAPMTAEMAVALMMAASKRLVPVDRAFRTHDWRERHNGAANLVLDGKTALVLGYGSIGRRVGVMCRALGMEVLAVRRNPGDEASVFPPEALLSLLPRAHALIVTLPGTPATEGMIGTMEIGLLPPGAVVVNVGRGAVIEQAALYHALRDGHLHGAGLDVWYTYPTDADSRANTPPADYPFHELDNVVMSPHRAGGGGAEEVEARRMTALAASLNAAARGEPLPHKVDVIAGY